VDLEAREVLAVVVEVAALVLDRDHGEGEVQGFWNQVDRLAWVEDHLALEA